MNTPLIAPSILAADFGNLQRDIEMINQSNADLIHFDVMDGNFVPNISFGIPVCEAVKQHAKKPIDVHLMIEPNPGLVERFAEAGADIVSVHPESDPNLHRTLQLVGALGKKAGLAINPATPLEVLEPVLEMLDLVLVMSVNPGFGGQSFLESALPRIDHIAQRIDALGLDTILEVDGGINETTAPRVRSAGATAFVAGTAVFRSRSNSYAEAIATLKGVI